MRRRIILAKVNKNIEQLTNVENRQKKSLIPFVECKKKKSIKFGFQRHSRRRYASNEIESKVIHGEFSSSLKTHNRQERNNNSESIHCKKKKRTKKKTKNKLSTCTNSIQ